MKRQCDNGLIRKFTRLGRNVVSNGIRLFDPYTGFLKEYQKQQRNITIVVAA